jgi:exopolysaccharide biosynthesis WecB/TagA/CpsF family protein
MGAAAAAGDLLLFCDADDVVHPDWLLRMVEGLEHAVAIGGPLVRIDGERADRWERPPATPGSLPTFVGVPYVVSANLGVRREVFDEVGGFDDGLVTGEDIALSWALLRRGHDLAYVPDAIVSYRPRPGLTTMMRQHYWYGRGMSQVLVRHGVPKTEDAPAPRLAMIRGNGQRGGRGSYVRFLRRSSIALGRGHGLLDEKLRGTRRTPAGTPHVESSTPSGRVRLLNLELDRVTMDEVLDLREGVVLTVHLDMLLKLQQDREFHALLPMFDVVTCDSQILFAALRLMRRPVPERVSGSDYFPRFCARYADDPSVRIFLCGAAPGVADAAASVINRGADRAIVVGTASPSMGFAWPSTEADEVTRAVRASGATVLVVALGAPRQEKFIAHVRSQLPNVRLFLPLGGTLDYVSGTVKRPPAVVTDLGLEWLWRVVGNPGERWRRYLVDDPKVVALLARDVVGRYRDPFADARAMDDERALVSVGTGSALGAKRPRESWDGDGQPADEGATR